MKKQLFIGSFILITILAATFLPPDNQVRAFHTDAELTILRQHVLFPIDSSILFPTSGNCSGCHGFDSNHYAMVDFFGNDVNIHDDWRSTMMANAAKDPFWRAKVSHEVLRNPSFATEIETKCTSCHAPMGHYTAMFRGHDSYTMQDLLQDTIGLDGVSCGTCHKISAEGIGDHLHSGTINFDTNRVIYGPYMEPFLGPMAEFVGFQPLFGAQVNDAGLCASCHTLITDAILPDGSATTGTTFIEQATYHEWLNSDYETEAITCQGCHMTQLEEEIVISSNYLFLEGRSPYGLHELAGGNTFMLELMKNFREELGIDALPEHFDQTISATYNMLQNRSLRTEVEWLGVEADTAYFGVKLTNLAGHKFPSGYPSRRLFVEFVLTSTTGDTLFHSGSWDDQYLLVGEDPSFEPHYDMINDPNQVQIYEMVAGDANGDFTVVLEHAYAMLKDNRLPPRGFTTTNEVYDTTQIFGQALNDVNFNIEDNEEGSGSDILYYHIPLQGYFGSAQLTVNCYYQSLPPKWVAPMLAEQTPEIDTFRHMFNSMDNTPVLVNNQQLTELEFPMINSTQNIAIQGISLYPNPSNQGLIQVKLATGIRFERATLYQANGQAVTSWTEHPGQIRLPGKGVFYLHLQTNRGYSINKLVSVK
ncbi:MAG: hypothetical protein DHS20C18_18120 [Saprospiraceae bacterium]|nr:MAG: hypothetical protein DHS20C18_18120 [Saprospiraceae bacterium]